jgi:anti-sigma B factor antagonist
VEVLQQPCGGLVDGEAKVNDRIDGAADARCSGRGDVAGDLNVFSRSGNLDSNLDRDRSLAAKTRPILAAAVGTPETDLQITHASRADWHVVTVMGEIDLYTAPALREGLMQAIESGAKHLAVDLRPVPFMDSMGLGVLIGARRRLSERDGQVALVCEEGPVRRVLDVSGLAKVFDVVGSLDELPRADAS